MQDYLKLHKNYSGTNPKLIAFAKQLEEAEDNYNEMLDLLLEELDEQEKEENRSYSQNKTEHVRLFELGLFA